MLQEMKSSGRETPVMSVRRSVLHSLQAYLKSPLFVTFTSSHTLHSPQSEKVLFLSKAFHVIAVKDIKFTQVNT